MRKYSIVCLFGVYCLSNVFSDTSEASETISQLPSAIEPVEITISPEENSSTESKLASQPMTQEQALEPLPSAVVVAQKPFVPFTGKIKGKKIRLRTSADLDSRVVKELSSQDLLVVVGEKGDFYAVEPPSGIKAYVFRTFVLDGIVEGNRVNVRLEPSLDAPVIGHLNHGDPIRGALSSLNNKWYEISPPATTRFYVAKEYIESIGGPEVKAQLDKHRLAAEQLLDSATLLMQAEMKKPYRHMDIEQIKRKYQTVMNEFTDFPDLCNQAKQAFNSLQEEYTQRKIAYLEDQTEEKRFSSEPQLASVAHVSMNFTDRMKMWEPVEESLYLAWAAYHDDLSMNEFYEEQKQGAVVLTGIVEPYSAPVKRKPGDFFLKDQELPQAYLYSTRINLQDYVGRKVSVVALPRSNNNFAFPAYFVISVE